MNRENVLKIAHNIFSNVMPISEQLYRAELYINSKKPAGIYYFDFSNKICSENLKEYQEDLLSKEYFENRGNLQWNYYIFFFQDQFDPQKKLEIEKNDRYARKFIFSEKEFEDFFRLEPSRSFLPKDIVLEWEKNLDAADLQEVYKTTPVLSAVERFYKNKTHKDKDTELTKESKYKEFKIDFINKLELTDQYRPYPETYRNFEFKKVNLIRGINGVGKTSLFEAIELIICGKTKRNPDKYEIEGAILAEFNDSLKAIYKPKQNELYRSRDLYWYSSNYPRDNYLYTSFNRYNYFNADAAFNFANSTNENDIKVALFNMVLGSEYNYISERSEKFYGYIRTEFNKLEQRINESQQKIIQSDQEIKQLSLSNKVLQIKQKVVENVKTLKFKKRYTDIEKSLLELDDHNNRLKSIIEKIKDDSNYSISQNELNKKLELLHVKKRLVENSIEEIKNKEIIQNNLKLQQETITSKTALITECKKYFRDKRLFEIKGTNSKFEMLVTQIDKIKQILEYFKQININEYKVNISLLEYLKLKNDLLNKLKEEKSTIEKTLKVELNKLGKVEKVIKEIKLLGKEFLTLKSDATLCPLCQSQYDKNELKERLELISSKETYIEAKHTQNLHNKLLQLENSIEILIEEINNANNIHKSCLILFPNENLQKNSLISIISSILKETDQLVKLNKNRKELEDMKTLFYSYNVSESEFIDLDKKVRQNLIPLRFNFESADKFINLEKDLKGQFESNNSEIEKLNKERKEILKRLIINLGINDNKKLDLKSINEIVLKDESILKRTLSYFKRLSELIDLDIDDSIDDIDLTSLVLRKNIESFKSNLKSQFEIDAAKKRKEDAELYIKVNQVKFNRLKSAKNTLESLTSKDGNKQMEEFFHQNLNEILDIFKTIHLPKEFESISFYKGQLFLTDMTNNKRKISEISSGQRSALALSIFISLNRKLQNGPNIIMFDDPVSFIDDFNVLSFLDFLRFFVLKQNKQIFFATANTKLSSLFEKKFEFLDDEYKIWDLKRVSNI